MASKLIGFSADPGLFFLWRRGPLILGGSGALSAGICGQRSILTSETRIGAARLESQLHAAIADERKRLAGSGADIMAERCDQGDGGIEFFFGACTRFRLQSWHD